MQFRVPCQILWIKNTRVFPPLIVNEALTTYWAIRHDVDETTTDNMREGQRKRDNSFFLALVKRTYKLTQSQRVCQTRKYELAHGLAKGH